MFNQKLFMLLTPSKPVTQSVIFTLVLLLTALFTPSSLAQVGTGTVRVAPNGNDSPNCGSVAAPCQTLQHAVDLIQVGGTLTILVAEGTYFYTGSGVSQTGREVMRIAGKNLTVKGGYTTDFSNNDPENNATIIDGQNARRGISVEQTNGTRASLSLSGVTLTNGRAPTDVGTSNSFGGGLDSFDSDVTLVNVKVTNNLAQGNDSSSAEPGRAGGGGLSFRQTVASLTNVELRGNTSQGGAGSGNAPRGGLGVGGGLFAFESNLTIDGLTATSNTAKAGNAPNGNGVDNGGIQRADGLGGGLNLTLSTINSAKNITVSDNLAEGGAASNKGGLGLGGGIFIELSNGVFPLNSSTIINNIARGGIASNEQGGAGLGGGIFITDSNVNFDAVSILNNQAIGVAGNQTGGDSGGGGIYFTLADINKRYSFTGSNLIIGSNSVTAGQGATNGLALGGGLHYSFNSDVLINHVTLAKNIAINGRFNQGAAIFVQNGTLLTSNFGIVADHLNASAILVNPTGTATMNRTLWSGNTSIKQGSGNFIDNDSKTGSPDFVAPNSSPPDFHIGANSAAREFAVGTTIAKDIDGENRPYISAPNANDLSDLGADEYYPSFLLTTTTVDSTTVQLKWGASEAQNLAGYKVEYQAMLGTNEANEGASPFTPSDGALSQSTLMSGLTSDSPYTITIQALDAGGGIIEKSNIVVATPTDIKRIYLPLVLK